LVFAREINDTLTSLVKKLDEAAGKHKDARMGTFVVFCSDEEGLEDKLKKLADKEKLDHVVLTIDSPAGPSKYKISKDAEVTVMLYTRQTVKENYAFKKGDLKEKEIDKIMEDLPKILPEKKE
jgi:hypothetical protein